MIFFWDLALWTTRYTTPITTHTAVAMIEYIAAVCVSLILYEVLRYRDARAWIRSRRGAFTTEEALSFRSDPPDAGAAAGSAAE